MKSCNLPLRKAIVAKYNTNPVAGVALSYNYIEPFFTGSYIVFSIISQREIGSSCSNAYAVNVQFKIYSSGTAANSGFNCDKIAEKIYDLFYPTKVTLLTLEDGFTHFGIALISDTITNKIEAGNQVYIDRIINLEFKIHS